jgi:hypothetical protein
MAIGLAFTTGGWLGSSVTAGLAGEPSTPAPTTTTTTAPAADPSNRPDDPDGAWQACGRIPSTDGVLACIERLQDPSRPGHGDGFGSGRTTAREPGT